MTSDDTPRQDDPGGSASQYFPFDAARLLPHVAHEGTGEVLARRVLERPAGRRLRFVDLVEIPPGVTIGRHTHGADEELYIVVSGTAVVELDGQPFAVGPGDVTLNRPGGTHALWTTGRDAVRMVVVCVDAPA